MSDVNTIKREGWRESGNAERQQQIPRVSFRREHWCWPHTRLEKTLAVVLAVLLALAIALAIALGVLAAAGYIRGKTCDRQACIESASSILANMDPTADPCVDFYQYACGSFVKQQIIPEDQSTVNTFNTIDRKLQAQMREILQEPPTERYNSSRYFRLVKDLYESCTNTRTIEVLRETPLLELLRSVGGWPVVEGGRWRESRFDWKKTIGQFRQKGIFMNYLVDVSVVKDLRNSSRFTLQVDQPVLGMPDRSYLLAGFGDPLVQAYFRLMVEVAVLVGATRANAQDAMRDALEFEMKLAEFSAPLEDLRNFTKLYNRMTVGELHTFAPQVDWADYLNILQLPKVIEDDDQVIVTVPGYVKQFAELVSGASGRTVANFLMWRTSYSLAKLLDRRFQVLLWEYSRVLTGEETPLARPYYCTDVVFENVDVAMGAIYVKSHFKPEAKAEASRIVQRVREEFQRRLRRLKWLDKQTLASAKQKASAMKDNIAYPDDLMDEAKVNGFYENLQITKEEYFQNSLRMNKFTSDYYLNRLTQKPEETQWIALGSAAVVNAYYKFSENSMIFFAGILNGAFFDVDRPKYLNYGSLGFIVGHEITHGFDDMGRQYDHNGNLNNWWDADTDRKFTEQTQCVISQYSDYTVPEVKQNVNGILTQGENIADIGGVKQAYGAYLKWEERHGAESPLPGIKLNTRQLFWMSNANVWCSKERPEYTRLELNTNPHAPSRFRVNGPLSNSAEFAKDFSCRLGSKMNPIKKCLVW